MTNTISPEQIILRLFVATILGACIGVERGRLDRGAGLRTHTMVALGSALIMIVSAFGFKDALHPPYVVLDPSRVAAQVVSGIGFLGAGTIILRREIVRGLTTAAGLWSVAAIGLAVGGGLYVAAIGATVLALIVLAAVKPLENRLYAHRQVHAIRITTKESKLVTLLTLRDTVEETGMRLDQIRIKAIANSDKSTIDLDVRGANPQAMLQLIDKLRFIRGVANAEASLGNRSYNTLHLKKSSAKNSGPAVGQDDDL